MRFYKLDDILYCFHLKVFLIYLILYILGERVSFAVTLLLAMTVFMLMVADMVPASSESIPLLGIFFIAVMIEMVLMIFCMCYILKLHLIEPEDGEEISPMMRRFVYDYLAFKFRVRKDGDRTNNKPPWQKDHEADKNGLSKTQNRVDGNVFNVEDRKERVANENDSTAVLMEKNLRVMTDKMREEENEKRIKHEFDVCANTLDIFAMILFVVLFVVITIVYLSTTT